MLAVMRGRAAPTIGKVLQEALERDERRKQERERFHGSGSSGRCGTPAFAVWFSPRCAKFASKTGALFPHALRDARALRSRQMTESDRVFTRDVIGDDRTRVERAVAASGRALEEK